MLPPFPSPHVPALISPSLKIILDAAIEIFPPLPPLVPVLLESSESSIETVSIAVIIISPASPADVSPKIYELETAILAPFVKVKLLTSI